MQGHSEKRYLTYGELAQVAEFRARSLAIIVNYSPRQVERIFLSVTGATPQSWLSEYRSILALVRLSTPVPLKTLAFDLGFKQTSHFSRVFKLYHGYSPSEARRVGQLELEQCAARLTRGVVYRQAMSVVDIRLGLKSS
ncbi:MAG: hypothetical protein RJA70_1037 [Pseudomonadota bacterium]